MSTLHMILLATGFLMVGYLSFLVMEMVDEPYFFYETVPLDFKLMASIKIVDGAVTLIIVTTQ